MGEWKRAPCVPFVGPLVMGRLVSLIAPLITPRAFINHDINDIDIAIAVIAYQ